MTDKQALAYAKHELEYYKQVKKDGITMTTQLEFYEIVVDAFQKLKKYEEICDVDEIDEVIEFLNSVG